LGRCKQKQRGLRGYYVAGPPLLNERYISLLRAPRLRNDLYCVEWDVKLYYAIPDSIQYNTVNTVQCKRIKAKESKSKRRRTNRLYQKKRCYCYTLRLIGPTAISCYIISVNSKIFKGLTVSCYE